MHLGDQVQTIWRVISVLCKQHRMYLCLTMHKVLDMSPGPTWEHHWQHQWNSIDGGAVAVMSFSERKEWESWLGINELSICQGLHFAKPNKRKNPDGIAIIVYGVHSPKHEVAG